MRALGVCYYPEHWPEEIWPEDAAAMVAAGLTWVRIGEFAWSRLEPEPGHLDFAWLDRAIAVLAGAGLKVVLGTPTATPPRWMLTRHPDMLAVDAQGRQRGFGSRRHYCFSHAGYRAESARIVTLLAERYGRAPGIAAWQPDNEYGCHDTTLSYSPAAATAFQSWLRARYGSIAALNSAWGTVFWAMEYRAFEEVGLPNLTVTEPHPAHVLAFRRFSSDQVVAFNRVQVDILRAATAAPILHNFMGRETGFDHFDVGRDVDIASWDSYPVGFLEDRIEADEAWRQAFRCQGDPDFQAFHHDLYRATGRGRWWVMEQQPGPVNWAPWNAAPLPGLARFWAWEAFAHGAEAVVYFRWRQLPFGQEQLHSGLLRPDRGETAALREVRQVAAELSDAPEIGQSAADVALIFDYPSAWGWEAQPQGQDFSYFRLVLEVYRGVRRLGLSVDILPGHAADLSAYAMVLAPGILAWDDALRAALAAYAGLAVLGPRAGARTAEFAIPPRLPPDLDPLDLKVEAVESLRPGVEIALAEGGAFRHWQEQCSGTAAVVERTEAGAPAVFAAGGLRYLAGWPDAVAMRRLLAGFAAEARLRTLDLPEGVRVRDTATERFVFNHTRDSVPASAVPGLQQPLGPADFVRLPRAEV